MTTLTVMELLQKRFDEGDIDVIMCAYINKEGELKFLCSGASTPELAILAMTVDKVTKDMIYGG